MNLRRDRSKATIGVSAMYAFGPKELMFFIESSLALNGVFLESRVHDPGTNPVSGSFTAEKGDDKYRGVVAVRVVLPHKDTTISIFGVWPADEDVAMAADFQKVLAGITAK